MPADMPPGSWFDEALYPDWGQRFKVVKELVHKRSPFQDIRIFESSSHGRVLVLDGIVQITERDEFIYQEMLAHVPLFMHPEPKRVLIIGAGDGGVLRHVLQHDTVEKAVMVEIDGDVIALSRKYLPMFGQDAWDDPRADVIVGDGIDYVRKAGDSQFDVIIVDSTDPIGVGDVLFTDDFYDNCARILSDEGIIVNQCGVPFQQADELRETTARRARFFPHVTAYLAAVPTYVGGFMTLGMAKKGAPPHRPDAALLARRAQESGIAGRCGYWTPEVHVASFSLPPYIAQNLPRP